MHFIPTHFLGGGGGGFGGGGNGLGIGGQFLDSLNSSGIDLKRHCHAPSDAGRRVLPIAKDAARRI